MRTKILQLLEGKNRIWDFEIWMSQTQTFICDEISAQLINPDFLNNFSRKQYLDEILDYLKSDKFFNKELRHQILIASIFFQTKEYHLSDEYLNKIIPVLNPQNYEENRIASYIFYCMARISLEKADFRSSNEYFIKSYQSILDHGSPNEKIFILINWIILFIESSYITLADKLLTHLSSHFIPKQDDNFAKLLFLQFFCQKKLNNLDGSINWVNMLLSMPALHLDEDDWYSVHIFAGEFYATLKRNFEKSIYHFTFANSFLSLKWKHFINHITLLKDYLKITDYLNIRIAYEDKMHEIILENNLHSSHYLNSLKSAYEELETVYTKVQEMSMTDSLTGLRNRRFLWIKAPEFIFLASSQKVCISCIMIDIDDFKHINDTNGHQTGDEVLKQLCHIIKEFFRKTDMVIRFGGEEIIALLLNSSLENTERICEQLRMNINNFIFSSKNKTIKLSVSVGISHRKVVKNQVKLIEEIIEESDLAMYFSKSNGKNQVNTYSKIKNIKRGNDGSGTHK